MENICICGTRRKKIITSAIGLLLVVAIAVVIVFTVGGVTSTSKSVQTTTEPVQTTTEPVQTTTESLFCYKLSWAN